ncbi:MAG: C4-dicarboxylate ABC transporter permease [Burkholderiales bacterium RIFCSPLOWO2_02_FULL_57_36]|nr:MAG: C4-dicarboxylate ABC transporter permease [Burkholderiales bacterium RIFCSPLOWO2_02_FULL_57_36]
MKILDHLEEWIVASLLAAMTLLTFSQVVLRYVFNSGWSWALEMTTILFAFMIFIGISYGVRKGAHIGVDALVKLMPPKVRRVSSIVTVLLCMLYSGMVLYGSYQYVYKMWVIGIELEDMPIPMWMARAILPFGYALLMFRFGQVLLNLLTGKSDSLHLADEAADALKLKSQGDQP